MKTIYIVATIFAGSIITFPASAQQTSEKICSDIVDDAANLVVLCDILKLLQTPHKILSVIPREQIPYTIIDNNGAETVNDTTSKAKLATRACEAIGFTGAASWVFGGNNSRLKENATTKVRVLTNLTCWYVE